MREDHIVVRRRLGVSLVVDYDFDTFTLTMRDVSGRIEKILRRQVVRPGRVANGQLVHVKDEHNIGSPFDAMVVGAKWWKCDDGSVGGRIVLYKGVSMRRAASAFVVAARDRENLEARYSDDLYKCVYDLSIQRTYGETDRTSKTVAVGDDIDVVDENFYKKQIAGN